MKITKNKILPKNITELSYVSDLSLEQESAIQKENIEVMKISKLPYRYYSGKYINIRYLKFIFGQYVNNYKLVNYKSLESLHMPKTNFFNFAVVKEFLLGIQFYFFISNFFKILIYNNFFFFVFFFFFLHLKNL